jgi:hypothetical protein
MGVGFSFGLFVEVCGVLFLLKREDTSQLVLPVRTLAAQGVEMRTSEELSAPLHDDIDIDAL